VVSVLRFTDSDYPFRIVNFFKLCSWWISLQLFLDITITIPIKPVSVGNSTEKNIMFLCISVLFVFISCFPDCFGLLLFAILWNRCGFFFRRLNSLVIRLRTKHKVWKIYTRPSENMIGNDSQLSSNINISRTMGRKGGGCMHRIYPYTAVSGYHYHYSH
jgi:hypothetical protein